MATLLFLLPIPHRQATLNTVVLIMPRTAINADRLLTGLTLAHGSS